MDRRRRVLGFANRHQINFNIEDLVTQSELTVSN